MATIEYWIQLENHPWDLCPRNVDRMLGSLTGLPMEAAGDMVFTSPTETHYQIHGNNIFRDALIFRRYKPPVDGGEPWTVPDDRKVNPWDLNERDPRERDDAGNMITGTMGTIPGPTIECDVGDDVIIHFKNRDERKESDGTTPIPINKRIHSLHTHGFVFAQQFDGAYPLSRLDLNQPISAGAEEGIWEQVPAPGGGADTLKQFKNAAGNAFKRGDRVPPGGTFDYRWSTIGWPTTAGVWIYHDHSIDDVTSTGAGAIGFVVIHNTNDENDVKETPAQLPNGSVNGSPIPNPEQDPQGQKVIEPPTEAQYLLLFHELNSFPCINGRVFLGNTPTVIAGPKTKMRFGVAGMGDHRNGFHTFHIHGHRWVIPGPDGNKLAGGGLGPNAIQNSPMVQAVSQFEDTKVFGPANSFSFTIVEDADTNSFMRAEPALGEWHMHCHVLTHMTGGMMGSLLVVEKDQELDLPQGVSNSDMVRMRLRLFEEMRAMHL